MDAPAELIVGRCFSVMGLFWVFACMYAQYNKKKVFTVILVDLPINDAKINPLFIKRLELLFVVVLEGYRDLSRLMANTHANQPKKYIDNSPYFGGYRQSW